MASKNTASKRSWKKTGLILLVVVVVLAILIPVTVLLVSKYFTEQEHTVRTDWTFETGDVIAEMDEWQVDFAEAELGDGLRAIQLVPQDIQEEGFSYYDLEVQERLEGALEELKHTGDMTWTGTICTTTSASAKMGKCWLWRKRGAVRR